MSKINKVIKTKEQKAVTNYMGGISFELNPLDNLKLVVTSSIFGEPSYYRKSALTTIKNRVPDFIEKYVLNKDMFVDTNTTEDIFIKAVRNALDYDYKATIDFIPVLRKEYYMRLNPAVIFIEAIQHQNRVKFNEKNPGYLTNIGKEISLIPTDLVNMFEYYIMKNDGKAKMPSILKRLFAKKLESFSKYHIAKYKNKGLIDLVRISHAHNETINELMQTGTVEIDKEDKTWENLRSEGKSWEKILKTIDIPHMALLRNLRNIYSEKMTKKRSEKILEKLKAGVKNGKQFPFRYYSAYKMIKQENFKYREDILNVLEDCIDLAMDNFPKLKGKTACLSDNSGSAWGTLNSEYGTTKIAEIANLSSVMTAINSEKGHVFTFGDKLIKNKIKSKKGVLKQVKDLDCRVGGATENGIWLFFDDIIKNKKHYDNIFIYSDMQAGHGGLFGKDAFEYKEYTCKNSRYIDVLKLVETYRKKVNSKVNVFSIQVAGYNNSLIPENLYRGAILSGWTGKEVLYAKEIIDFWDKKS